MLHELLEGGNVREVLSHPLIEISSKYVLILEDDREALLMSGDSDKEIINTMAIHFDMEVKYIRLEFPNYYLVSNRVGDKYNVYPIVSK